MSKTKTLGELFDEVEAERAALVEETPAEIAKREAKRKADIEREIRQGLRDANGDWIEQPEDEEDEEDDDEERDGDA